MAASCDDVASEAHVTDAMIDRGMDGIIMIAPVSSRRRLQRVASTVPTVVVGRHGRSPAYDTVTDDDFAGAELVVEHLAGLGHRRIAHVEHLERDPVRLVEMPNAPARRWLPPHQARTRPCRWHRRRLPALVVRRTTAPPG